MKFGNRHFLILVLFLGDVGRNPSREVSVDSGMEEERGHSMSEWPMVEGLRRRKGGDPVVSGEIASAEFPHNSRSKQD